MIKMIVSDMDGTLLNSQKQLPDDFREVYQMMKGADVQFVVASGRQYYTLLDEFMHLDHTIAFVAENGGFINWQGQSKVINPLKAPEAAELITAIRQIKGADIVLCGKQGAYVEAADSADFMSETAKYYIKHTVVDDLTAVDDEILKIAVNDFSTLESSTYPLIREAFDGRFQVCTSSPVWLDIMPKGVNKGEAVAFLQNQFGVLPGETMVFGDYLNDYEMLQKGDFSYAMANAHPEILKIANYKADSNDNAGVSKIIREKLRVLRE